MNKNLIGNLIAYGPIAFYLIYTIIIKKNEEGIDWSEVLIASLIGMISGSIGKKIKNKGKVE